MAFTIAVDVGTSSTKVAVFDHSQGIVKALPIHAEKALASCVFVEGSQWRFGKGALSRPARSCAFLLRDFKRTSCLLDPTLAAAQREAAATTHLTLAPAGEPAFEVGDGRQVTLRAALEGLIEHVAEACWEALRHGDSAAGVGEGDSPRVRRLVLTVPDSFVESQRALFREAGEAAVGRVFGGGGGGEGRSRRGRVPMVEVRDESLGPALLHVLNHAEDTSDPLLIVDWGGGSLNVSAYRLASGVLQRLAFQTRPFVGACDLEYNLMLQMQQKFGPDLMRDAVSKFKLRKAVGAAVTDLTVDESCEIEVEVSGKDVMFKVTRGAFDEFCMPQYCELVEIVESVLDEAGLKQGGPDNVQAIMVGGATRVPYVEKILSDLMLEFNGLENVQPGWKGVLKTLNRDNSVVCGAAMAGGVTVFEGGVSLDEVRKSCAKKRRSALQTPISPGPKNKHPSEPTTPQGCVPRNVDDTFRKPNRGNLFGSNSPNKHQKSSPNKSSTPGRQHGSSSVEGFSEEAQSAGRKICRWAVLVRRRLLCRHIRTQMSKHQLIFVYAKGHLGLALAYWEVRALHRKIHDRQFLDFLMKWTKDGPPVTLSS